MDCIPRGIDPRWLKLIFQTEGTVVDVYISRKIKRFRKDAFGFVRFNRRQEAEKAIKNLNGFGMKDCKLRVSMARFNKGGIPTKNQNPAINHHNTYSRKIKSPALRDHRKYSEVLLEKPAKSVETNNIIPIKFTLTATENLDIVSHLKYSIIAENTDVLNLAQTTAEVHTCSKTVKGMFYLSPTKLLIVFDCPLDVENALSVDSEMWHIFDDLRLWSDGEFVDDRLVWMECFGIHPKCWSVENIRKIGEKWGPVIHIDNKIENLRSITNARMLVRTKAQNKIDDRIRLIFEHGSCDVWVKECCVNEEKLCRMVKMSKDCDILGAGEIISDHLNCKQSWVGKVDEMHDTDQGLPDFIDPLIPELVGKCIQSSTPGWIDPIVVDEAVTRTVSSNDVVQDPFPRPEDHDLLNQFSTPTIPTHSRNPRGRPKRVMKQLQLDAQNSPATMSMSLLEA